MLNALILKYGEVVSINGNATKAVIDQDRTSSYKTEAGFSLFTGLRTATILIREVLQDTDIIKIQGTNFRVFKTEAIRKKARQIYSEALVFEDDFVHNIKIFKEFLDTVGVNLPKQGSTAPLNFKARLRTLTDNEALTYARYGRKVPSHVFTILAPTTDVIVSTDKILFGTRNFEVLGIQNVDEAGRFLILDAIENLK